jgi:hypothetical protein
MKSGYIKYKLSKDLCIDDITDNCKEYVNSDLEEISKEEFYRPFIDRFKKGNGYVEYFYHSRGPLYIIKMLLKLDPDVIIEDAKLYRESCNFWSSTYILDIVKNKFTFMRARRPFEWDNENNTYKIVPGYTKYTGHINTLHKFSLI